MVMRSFVFVCFREYSYLFIMNMFEYICTDFTIAVHWRKLKMLFHWVENKSVLTFHQNTVYTHIHTYTRAISWLFRCHDDNVPVVAAWPPFQASLDRPTSQIARFMVPTWGPPGPCRPQMGPMLAPWTLLSGMASCNSKSALLPNVPCGHGFFFNSRINTVEVLMLHIFPENMIMFIHSYLFHK